MQSFQRVSAGVTATESGKHGCHRLRRRRRGTPDRQVQTETDCRFEFRDGTTTVTKHRQPGRRIRTRSWRGFGLRLAAVVLVTAWTNAAVRLRNVVFYSVLSCGAKQHNIPQYAQLARALPAIQRHTALSSNNEPIHIKRHNESPVSRLAETTGCRCRRGADKSCMHGIKNSNGPPSCYFIFLTAECTTEGAVLFIENSECVYVSVCGLLEMDWGLWRKKKKRTNSIQMEREDLRQQTLGPVIIWIN